MDYETHFARCADKILMRLVEPINSDLLYAVAMHGIDPNSQDSFMFTFTTTEKMDFDSFAALDHQLDALVDELARDLGRVRTPDYRTMSQRYDEYLARSGRLDEAQTKRFDAIVREVDDGWSGSVYGHVMRLVQRRIRRVMNN